MASLTNTELSRTFSQLIAAAKKAGVANTDAWFLSNGAGAIYRIINCTEDSKCIEVFGATKASANKGMQYMIHAYETVISATDR